MKQNGQEFNLRNSNHKYYMLDDLDMLFERLKEVSVGKLAKELNVPQNSIRYRVMRYFTEEQIAAIKKDRRYHRKRKTSEPVVATATCTLGNG